MACFWVDSTHHPQANPLTLGIDWKIGIAAKDWDSVAKKEKIEASHTSLCIFSKSSFSVLLSDVIITPLLL